MFRGIVLLQYFLLPVLSLGSGCTIDAAGKNVCPEDGGDSAALLQSKLTVNASTIETLGNEKQEAPMMVQHGTVPPECVAEVDTDTGDDLIDVDKMIKDFKCQAATLVVDLQAQVDAARPAFDSAKQTFRNARSTLRAHFRNCKGKIFWNQNKWPSKSECTTFRPHIRCSSRRRQNQPSCPGGEDRRRRLTSTCWNKEKCILRQARITMKRELKNEFMETRDKYRSLKKELRKAKAQKNWLPKILKAMKPQLLEALENVDMNEGLEGPLSNVPIEQITLPSLLQNFMEVSLNAQLSPQLEQLRDKILKKIWDFVKPAYDAIKSSFQTLVGSIPVVGGVLSVAIGFLIEKLYEYLKDGVKDALDKVRIDLQGRLVTKIVNAIMATGLFTAEALADSANSASLLTTMANTASATQQAEVQAEQATVVSTATAAKSQALADAANVENEVRSDGDTLAAEEAAEQQEDETDDEQQDQLDADDEPDSR